MRKVYSPRVERGRVRIGKYATVARSPYGAFIFRLEEGVDVSVIASPTSGINHEPWEHVSVSIIGATRTPTWEEMAQIKRLFFEDDETVMQLHVPTERHINLHPYVLHLWRPAHLEVPTPPIEAV